MGWNTYSWLSVARTAGLLLLILNTSGGSFQSADEFTDDFEALFLERNGTTRRNCSYEEEYNCQTSVNGNTCNVIGGKYNCTCNAYDFVADAYDLSCRRLNCTQYEKERCRTDVFGNSCYYNGQIAQCRCKAKGFVDTDRRTKCTRSYCSDEENYLCRTQFGNDCVIRNDGPLCQCYGQFEAVDRDSECRQTNCSWSERERCQSHWSKNVCYTNGTDFHCTCNQPGYSTAANGQLCIRKNCTEHENNLCQTDEYGNRCIASANNTEHECRCYADGFIPSIDNRRCQRENCTEYQNNLCRTDVYGNRCRAINNTEYECRCYADGFNSSSDNKQCQRQSQSNCTQLQEAACQTNMNGNECFSYGRNYSCSCNANGYENHGLHECRRENCTEYQNDLCRTDVYGNRCRAINNTEYECRCYADGFNSSSDNKRCQRESQSNCTQLQEAACQTNMNGNECFSNGRNYRCSCNANGYENYGQYECRRENCTEYENYLCRTDVYGNRCRVVNNTQHECRCYADGFNSSSDNKRCQRQSQSNCTQLQEAACQSNMTGNECFSYGRNYSCNCNANGYENHGQYECRREGCTEHENSLCRTDVYGNRCNFINSTEHVCRCYADGFNSSSDNKRCQRIGCTDFENDLCRTETRGNRCLFTINQEYECCCHADGFIPSYDYKRCQRQGHCTAAEEAACHTNATGNSCIFTGRDYRCNCSAAGYENYDHYECRRFNVCSEYMKAECQTDVYGNECIPDGNNYRCSCYAEGFANYGGYQCRRTNCTEYEDNLCRTDEYGNLCIVLNKTEHECRCLASGFNTSFDKQRCQSFQATNSCSVKEKSMCRTQELGNLCNVTRIANNNTEYECSCGADEFISSWDNKRCIRFQATNSCSVMGEDMCQTQELRNLCNVTRMANNNTEYECSCGADGFISSRDNKRCIRVNCSEEQKKSCDPYDEGNTCRIDASEIHRCTCHATGSFLDSWHGRKERCLSIFCHKPSDKFSCKSDVEGNNCTRVNGLTRKCTCNEIDYTLEGENANDPTCRRIKCTSYEQDECHAEQQGNSCEVTSDVHRCTCNAAGYKVELPSLQRCIELVNSTMT